MIKFNTNKIAFSFGIYLIATVSSIIFNYLSLCILNIDYILIAIVSFAAFLILNLVINSKANVINLFLLSLINFGLFFTSLILSVSFSILFMNRHLSTSIEIDLISIILLIPIIILVVNKFIKLKPNKIISSNEAEIPEKTMQDNLESEPSIITNNEINNVVDEVQSKPDSQNLFKEEDKEKIIITPPVEDEQVELLGSLLSIKIKDEELKLDENISIDVKNEEIKQQTKQDIIPQNARLKPQSYNIEENNSQIPSIGKLLINERDLINIIESNALMQVIGSSDLNKNIVTSQAGEVFKDKINKIQQISSEINNIAFIQENGYVLASNYQDKKEEQLTGAMHSGIISLIQNYFTQIEKYNVNKVFFDFKTDSQMLFDFKDYILFSTTKNQTEFLNCNNLNSIMLNVENLSNSPGYNEILKTDYNGTVYEHKNILNPEKYAGITLAIYENFRSLLQELYNLDLEKIIAINDNETIVITNFNEKVILLTAPNSQLVRLTDKTKQMIN